MRKALLSILLILTVPGPATAGPFEDGGTAFLKNDYVTALPLWRSLADQGNAGAQNNLGFMYRFSVGVPQDYAEAVRWYRKAAEQGDADAPVFGVLASVIGTFSKLWAFVIGMFSEAWVFVLALALFVLKLLHLASERHIDRQRSLWREDYNATDAMPPGARRAWARSRLFFRRLGEGGHRFRGK